MTVLDLPGINATLNGVSALLLVTGYRFIRRGDVERHRLCMVTAFVVSVLFLVSYVVYHYHVGSTRFPGTGWIRAAYLTLLFSHVVLAALVPPLAIVTLYRGARGDVPRHRRIARITLPVWLYVSVTGVVIYVVLYRLYAAA
jgi:uncharacterized membrane protein YozB (DUF420 family)